MNYIAKSYPLKQLNDLQFFHKTANDAVSCRENTTIVAFEKEIMTVVPLVSYKTMSFC